MGNTISEYVWRKSDDDSSNEAAATLATTTSTSRGSGFFGLRRKDRVTKRRRNSAHDDEDECSTKVIKLDTAKYLHQKLFVEGRKSDVTIVALGHEWHLHRIYLEQCEYFRCLFSGNWKDSEENRYDFDMLDDHITFEGLNTVFASLYQNEIRFELKDIGGILSAAMLFNLQVCVERCEDLMLQNIDEFSVVEFLELSQRYSCLHSRDRCTSYLARFFWKLALNDEFLKRLSYDIMILIYSQPELCVVEGEKDLYNAMKRWIYITEENKLGCSQATLHQYFVDKPPHSFYKYSALISRIRFQHMITSKRTLDTLRAEHIVGEEILLRIVNNQWETLLVNEEKQLLEDTVSDEFFYTHCRRLGRSLTEDKCWRWAGIDFGLDLLFRCQYGMISMIRNLSRDPVNHSLSLRKEYKIHYRLLVLDKDGNIVVDTKRKFANLGVDQKEFLTSYPVDLKEFSVHLFYVNHLPGLAATEFWSTDSQ